MDKQIEAVPANTEGVEMARAIGRIIDGGRVEQNVGDWKISSSEDGNEIEVRSTDGKSSLSFNWVVLDGNIALGNTLRGVDGTQLAEAMQMLNQAFEALSRNKNKEIVISFDAVEDGSMKNWLLQNGYKADGDELHRRINPSNLAN